MRAALVITTYNNPRYLGICLRSFSNQTSSNFEIFVADDGSKEETAAKIEDFKRHFDRKVHHFWHPDTGYRKSTINNEVFRNLAGYDIVICVDHDVIAHHRFIEDHLSIHEKYPNAVFMGRRVELGPVISAKVSEENVTDFNRGFSRGLFISGLKGDSQNSLRGLRIGSPLLQKLFKRNRVPDLLGSNFSVTWDLLKRVNGYNEDFQSYWGEDGDLFVRLRNVGAELVGLKGYAVQYHLSHPRLDPDRSSQQRYEEILKDTTYTRCKNGIVKE
jgi:glycosyltransferase involved in cell wall biosynthesis